MIFDHPDPDTRFAELDALSRTRALDNAESMELERLVKRIDYRERNRAAKRGTGKILPFKPRMSPEEKRIALEAVQQGKTIAEAARLVGRTHATIQYALGMRNR